MLAQTVPVKLTVPQDSTAALAIAICLLQGTLLCHHSPIHSQSADTSTPRYTPPPPRLRKKQPASIYSLRYIRLFHGDVHTTHTHVYTVASKVQPYLLRNTLTRGLSLGEIWSLKLTSQRCSSLSLCFFILKFTQWMITKPKVIQLWPIVSEFRHFYSFIHFLPQLFAEVTFLKGQRGISLLCWGSSATGSQSSETVTKSWVSSDGRTLPVVNSAETFCREKE